MSNLSFDDLKNNTEYKLSKWNLNMYRFIYIIYNIIQTLKYDVIGILNS